MSASSAKRLCASPASNVPKPWAKHRASRKTPPRGKWGNMASFCCPPESSHLQENWVKCKEEFTWLKFVGKILRIFLTINTGNNFLRFLWPRFWNLWPPGLLPLSGRVDPESHASWTSAVSCFRKDLEKRRARSVSWDTNPFIRAHSGLRSKSLLNYPRAIVLLIFKMTHTPFCNFAQYLFEHYSERPRGFYCFPIELRSHGWARTINLFQYPSLHDYEQRHMQSN